MAEWLENLPDDLKENETLKQTPDVETLAKRFLETKAAVGNGIRIPSEDASEEVWNEFNEKLRTRVPDLVNVKDKDGVFAKLGRPESPDGYELGETQVELDETFESDLKKTAHELGLTNEQFQGIMSKNLDAVKQVQSKSEEAKKEAESALKERWGDAYGTKRSNAVLAAEKYGLVDQLDTAPVGLMEALSDVGATLGEPQSPGNTGTRAGALTPGEAKARISEIQGNPKHPYHDRRHPGHNQAVEEFHKLHQALVAGRG